MIIRAGTDGGTVEVKPNGDVVILPGAAGNVYLGDGVAGWLTAAEGDRVAADLNAKAELVGRASPSLQWPPTGRVTGT